MLKMFYLRCLVKSESANVWQQVKTEVRVTVTLLTSLLSSAENSFWAGCECLSY